MRRRLTGGALLLALAGTLLIAYRSDRLLFEIPAELVSRCADKLSWELAKDRDLYFLMTFDEARPVEWIGRGEVHWPGTESVPGQFGQARRFDGKPRSHIETTARWSNLGPNYTLSLWVKLEPTGLDQDIWHTAIEGRTTGFKLRNGQLTFFVPGGTVEQIASYPFDAFGRFVHLAAVVESPSGKARLYEDGELKAEIPIEAVAQKNHNMEFGKMRWSVVDSPLCGAIDEAAAWNQPLSPQEIRALAHARHSLPSTLAAYPYWRWRIAGVVQTVVLDTLKLLDRFNPLLHEGRVADADLPCISLYFSSSDARHFIRAHDRSLASGRRTGRGADPRRIHAQYNGHTVEAQLCLDGSDTRYFPSRRPGFILETPEVSAAFGARRLRLIPPESLETGLPGIAAALANAGVSNAPGGLCRLTIDGQFKGIYVFESFDRRGLKPGERAGVVEGPSKRTKWGWLFRALPPDHVWKTADLPHGDLKTWLDQAKRLLINDLHHPWSAREWDWRIRQQLAAPPPPCPLWPDMLSPFEILGRNPSPDYIVEDLDLQGFRGLPTDTVWSSSRPDLIDGHGKVSRPEGDRPIRVELTATRRAESATETRTLSFRVMPKDRKLSALMLFCDEPLTLFRRVDFQALYHPAHDEGPPRRLQGGQGTGAGIKHRGNATFWDCTGKKPLSLQFDEPHHLLDGTETRHLNLLNGCVDSTKLRNKLAYDLFRAFAQEGKPRYAPELGWTEVFVNGTYRGVYEMCTRIHGCLLGVEEDPSNPEDSLLLYQQGAAPKYFFAEAWDDEFAQVLPPPRKQLRTQPMYDLLLLTSRANPKRFARRIGNWVDLDNAIDYLLLINGTGNIDGRTANFYLAREAAPNSLFFFIPYDYDHSFEATTWLTNHLFDRLRNELPGFEDRLRRRWSELRQGPLATAALEARIDGMAAQLDGYMDWDLAMAGAPPTLGYLDQVEELRQAMRKQLDFVDSQLGFEAGAPLNP